MGLDLCQASQTLKMKSFNMNFAPDVLEDVKYHIAERATSEEN